MGQSLGLMLLRQPSAANDVPGPPGPGTSITQEPDGARRAGRFVVMVLALQRASYLPALLTSLGSSGYRMAPLNAALVVISVAWNVIMLCRVRRKGWFDPWIAWADVAWAASILILVPWNAHHAAPDWSSRAGESTAALAGVAGEPLAAAIAAVAALVGAHVVATFVALGGPPRLLPELVSCLRGLSWFMIILGFSLRYLRRQGGSLDRATTQLLTLQSRRAADRARYAIRLAHHRALHDTALATLSAIARGNLDYRADQVRLRCARDAEHLKRLLANDQDRGGLGERLDEMLEELIIGEEGFGIRFHHRSDRVPADLRTEVVDAMCGAAREALNNVAAHAHVTEAWLTASWDDPVLTVRVVDRGDGFDPAVQAFGFGLRESIIGRLREVGGGARIVSEPGEGTVVELTWRAPEERHR